MTISVAEITSIIRAVADEQSGSLELLGVVGMEGGADRIEVLMRVGDLPHDLSLLLLNVGRESGRAFAIELRESVKRALVRRRTAAAVGAEIHRPTSSTGIGSLPLPNRHTLVPPVLVPSLATDPGSESRH